MSIQIIGDRGDWNKISQDSALIERLNREAEKDPGNPNPAQPKPLVNQDVSGNVLSNQEHWTIPVNYRNGIYQLDLAKSLLDNGKSRTQQDWAEYRKLAEPKGDFYTGDMPLCHAVFTSLFNQKDKPESEEARKFIQEQMRARWFMTLTRVVYQPKGKDKVIHNFGLNKVFGPNQEYSLEENIVGKDGAIEKGDSSALTALLGTGDVDEIKAVYNWINQTPTYIWRLNSKPTNLDERVARFGAISGRALFDCYWDAGYSYPSLGVRIASGASGRHKIK